MQRVVSINLNGNVFQLEENGYTALFACLDALETSLKDNPDRVEIAAGVERAIAEKCQACLSPHKAVITNAEVARIISEVQPMPGQPAPGEPVQGEPAGAGTGPGAGPAGGVGAGEKARAEPHYPRRLCQIREGGMVGGVCLGLATFFHIDVTLVRILFAIFALATGGWGILAYLALMVILPRATSVAEAETPGPQQWPWDNGWPWDKHGWPWDRPDWTFGGSQRQEWRQQRQDWRQQRAEWRQQRREWRNERRAARMSYGPPPSVLGTVVIVFFVMLAFGWLAFWMRGSFLPGWPIFWGGPFFWGFPHWLGIVLVFVFLRFLLWPVWGGRGGYGYHGYGLYQPYSPWMAMWHAIVWIASIIFAIWLLAQFVPGFHEFLV